MRVLVKIVLPAVLCSVVFAFSCVQEELLDLAKNGTGLVYVVTKDAGNNVTLHVASDRDFYRSYYVGNTPNIIEGVFATRRGEVAILRTAGMYVSKGDYSYWGDETPPFPGAGTKIFSFDDRIIAISSGTIYERSDSGWTSIGSFTNIPPLAYAREGDTIFCVGNANSIQSFQLNGGGLDSTYNITPSFTPAIGGTLFAYKNGSSFLIGGSNAFYQDPVDSGRTGGVFNRVGSDIAAAVPGGTAQSYAIVDGGDVFAGVADANLLYLLRLVPGAWSNENLPFTTGAAPIIEIYPLRNGKIAIWAKIVPEQGVYIYNYDEKKYKKLSQINPSEIVRVNVAN